MQPDAYCSFDVIADEAPSGAVTYESVLGAASPLDGSARDFVEALQREHGDDRHRFIRLDLTVDPLPGADLVLCRDCLVHLPNDLVQYSLQTFFLDHAEHYSELVR